MKKIAVIVAWLLILGVGYVAAGPYRTVSAIKSGMAEQDSEKLAKHIEFPALRRNLKEQLNAAVLKNTAAAFDDYLLATLTAGLAAKMVDGMVDYLVTPSNLVAFMEGRKPSRDGGDSGKGSRERQSLFQDARFSYDSMDKCSVWVPTDDGEEIRFVLQRDGVSWKLVNLILPMDKGS